MSKATITIDNSPLCYDTMCTRVVNYFEKRRYRELVDLGKNGQHQGKIHVYTCGSGAHIILEFPGTKAGINKRGHFCYDYRVRYKSKIADRIFSHVDLVLDIVWKIRDGVISPTAMQKLLRGIARGDIIPDPPKYYRRLPPSNLTDLARQAYANKEKAPPKELEPIDLTPEELSVTIFWILLQEDINYPRERGLQGRQMPLNRYAEAVWATSDVPSRLVNVLERTLTEQAIPSPLAACDYSYVKLARDEL